jgi:26S proteasome regulatory subunit N9
MQDELKNNKSKLEQKVRLMAFLELAFNLPKSNRVISFDTLQRACSIPIEHVEFMVMKAMSLGLVHGSINQINRDVTISWVAPKVLEAQRISTMLGKFEEWETGVKGVEALIQRITART